MIHQQLIQQLVKYIQRFLFFMDAESNKQEQHRLYIQVKISHRDFNLQKSNIKQVFKKVKLMFIGRIVFNTLQAMKKTIQTNPA